jgi:hypothetical protein
METPIYDWNQNLTIKIYDWNQLRNTERKPQFHYNLDF